MLETEETVSEWPKLKIASKTTSNDLYFTIERSTTTLVSHFVLSHHNPAPKSNESLAPLEMMEHGMNIINKGLKFNQLIITRELNKEVKITPTFILA